MRADYSQSLFSRRGTLVENNGREGRLGIWRHENGRHYESTFEFLQFNPDGSPAGVLEVWSKIRLNADGKTLPLAEFARS